MLKSWDKYFYLQDSDKISKELIKKGSVTLPGKQILASFDKIVQGISKRYSENIPDVFSDKEGNLSKASIEIDLEKPGYLSSSKSITVKIGETHTVQGKIEDDSVYISTIASGDDSPPKFLIEGIVNVLIGRLVLAGYFPRPFISTSEVLGISLFYKELDAAKSVLVEELQRLKKDEGYKNGINPFELVEKMSSRYAAPIKDNIRFTRDIGEIQKIGTSTDSKHLVDKLKFMMDGYFRKVDKGEIRFISKARKKRRFDIPLYLGSTAARELTILFFFLGHIAEEGMILMIDEPESHLSPANQIEIARLLALCVNAGLKVFITTHSDFLIKEFNNLIMLSQDFKGKKDFLKKNSGIYSERDFLKPESVNAYICKDGTLKKCFVDKKGMDINSFDETIDEINRISDELDFLTDD